MYAGTDRFSFILHGHFKLLPHLRYRDMYTRLKHSNTLLTALMCLLAAGLFSFAGPENDDNILSYTVDPAVQDLDLYWKDDQGQILGSLGNLKKYVEGKGQNLVFAMNAGMFKKDHSPQGLFIRGLKTIAPLDTGSAYGNFYLKPNGVFYVTTARVPVVCTTERFSNKGDVLCATQSGPMLLIDGAIHPAFRKGSQNLNVRNGVGILSDGKALFAMSKTEINLYDFAEWFQRKGCKNALYLDGSVSRTYLPEKNWTQMDGIFGVMIGVTEAGDR